MAPPPVVCDTHQIVCEGCADVRRIMKNVVFKSFSQALAEAEAVPRRWSEVAEDPNDPRALVWRARTLRAAWREPIPDRSEFVVARCAGRRVLDIGCVAHDVERMKSPQWLHSRVAVAASSCVGVDVLPEGVAQMRKAGYDVIAHDLTRGPGPLANADPFDVIVAGELIEHVPSLDMLFTAACDLLAPDGELIITTPNPWAPHRVAAGQRGDCWENVDHILFAFPSGIAELAERHGLVLREAMTTRPEAPSRRPMELARRLRRRLRGTAWMQMGYRTRGTEVPVRIGGSAPRPSSRGLRHGAFVGETFVYVVRRTAVPT
ncbi:class I SAM-dependent methyltransferase [Knoellia flava]|nr:class I SAM-dependent methyltransferase [Knoellia flava]